MRDAAPHSLYSNLVGPAWSSVHPSVRRAHEARITRASGDFRVERGTNPMARMIGTLLRLPRAGDPVLVSLVIDRSPDREVWRRTFADRPLASVQARGPGGLLLERFGLIELRLTLTVIDGALRFETRSVSLRAGRLRIPLPGSLGARITARVHGADDGADDRAFQVQVELTHPILGRLLRYSGTLTRVEVDP